MPADSTLLIYRRPSAPVPRPDRPPAFVVGLRVLVADARADAAASLAAALVRAGADVRVCPTGEAAAAAWDAFRPDAAVVEPDLPGMSGYALARWVRLEEDGRGVFLAAVPAAGGADAARQAAAAGFDAHLAGPADPAAVVAVLAGVRPGRGRSGNA